VQIAAADAMWSKRRGFRGIISMYGCKNTNTEKSRRERSEEAYVNRRPKGDEILSGTNEDATQHHRTKLFHTFGTTRASPLLPRLRDELFVACVGAEWLASRDSRRHAQPASSR
jgi:hypothetical protein